MADSSEQFTIGAEASCTDGPCGKLNRVVIDPVARELTHLIEGTTEYAAYGTEQAVFWPHYGYRGTRGTEVTTDAIPPGELEVRRGDPVHATDGEIGRVQGLVIDPGSHHVTHVLLQEGHLWGRKEVSIPVGAVTKIDDRIELNLTKKQVEGLPPVDIEHPGG